MATVNLGHVVGPGVPSGGSEGQVLVKKSGTNYDTEWANQVKSVNGTSPDEHGDISVNEVNFARDLITDDNQQSSAEYIIRTTGGDASISDGNAWLRKITGRMVHSGYTAENVVMTVTPGEESTISAVIDDDAFLAEMTSASGTKTFTYGSSAWGSNPASYGITVTGTPVTGDEISVAYQKEVRGTITVANPTAFKSTGWNLYNHTNGYARVVKYSSLYGFLIGGTYTKLEYAETLTGTKQTITPASGYFTIPGDGYLFVTGGNNTDTYIMMTWSDWVNGYEGSWKAYSESTVSLSAAMEYLTAGLCQIGAIADEIDLVMQLAISRIERMSYSAENLATVKASGRAYTYDENYIYAVRETPVQYSITIDGAFTANDHGMEFFAGTSVQCYAETLYGANLVDRLRTDIPNAISALQNYTATYTATTGSLASVEAELATLGASLADHQFKNIKIRTNAASGYFEASTSYYGTLKRNTTGLYMVDLQGTGSVKQVIYGLYSSGAWTWDSIPDRISTKVASVSAENSNYTYGGVTFRRTGNVMYVKIAGVVNLPAGGYTKICTIPSGFIPSANLEVDLAAGSDNSNVSNPRIIRLRIETGGDFKVYNYGAAMSNNNIMLAGVYVI